MLLNPDIESRLHAKLDKSGDCWLWTGYVQKDGYATLKNNGKAVKIHRVMYVLTHGSIPEGKQIDHKCRVRHCANPGHLRAVTNKQNMENLTPREGKVRGIYWNKAKRRWMGRVYHHGQYHYAGLFVDKADAAHAVVMLRGALYTHEC